MSGYLELGSLGVLAIILLIPYYVSIPIFPQMLTVSMVLILFGSERAARRESNRKRMGDAAEPRDVLSGSAVYRFPLTASLMLIALFLAFKYLPEEWVSMILTIGSASMGVFSFAGVLAAIIDFFVPVLMDMKLWAITMSDVISVIITAPVGIWYYFSKHFIANNIMACGLALSAIEYLGLEDYKSGALLLLGLFIYDIFWVFGSSKVFGSNVMVTVAKKFQGPIKLLFPRHAFPTEADFSLLGLGDIVIPGLFVAMMWRFDERHGAASWNPKSKPYFTACMVGYFLAVVATYSALVVFNAAQPALLYIVPGLLLSTLITAAARNELHELITYSEAETESAASTPAVAAVANGEQKPAEVLPPTDVAAKKEN